MFTVRMYYVLEGRDTKTEYTCMGKCRICPSVVLLRSTRNYNNLKHGHYYRNKQQQQQQNKRKGCSHTYTGWFEVLSTSHPEL